jgi:hypothetical protein
MQTLILSGSLVVTGPDNSSGVAEETVQLQLPDSATTWDFDESVDDLGKVLVKALMQQASQIEHQLSREAMERRAVEFRAQIEAEREQIEAERAKAAEEFLQRQFSRAWDRDESEQEAAEAAARMARAAVNGELSELGRDEDEPLEDAIREWQELRVG